MTWLLSESYHNTAKTENSYKTLVSIIGLKCSNLKDKVISSPIWKLIITVWDQHSHLPQMLFIKEDLLPYIYLFAIDV